MALALVGLGLLVARASRDERDGALLVGGLAVTGFLLSLAFLAAGSDALITRNIIGLWLPATILVAGGLGAIEGRLLGSVATAGLCAIGLTAAIGVQADYNLQRPDWRPVAAALGPAPKGSDERLVLIQHYRTLLPLSLYMRDLRFLTGTAAHRVTEIDVIAISSPQQPLCWWGAACNLIPSELQSRYRIRGFRTAEFGMSNSSRSCGS